MKRILKKNGKIICTLLIILTFGIQTVNAGNYDEQKEAAKNQIYEAEKSIEELNGLKSDVESYIRKIDSDVSTMERNISSINAQCEAKQQEIDTSIAVIVQTEAEMEQQYQDMKKRIKFMYENADVRYVEMILGSENFSDFLNKADFFSELTNYDREMIAKMEATKLEMEARKIQLEAEKQSLDVLREDALAQKAEMEKLASEKEKQMSVYETQIDLEKKELEAQQAILEKIIQLEKAGNTDDYYAGGQLTWPVPSSYRITSRFGPRNTGIPGASTYHRGIDIGAPTGSTIVAACSGTVTIASYGYNGGAGNYVSVNHGNGLTTVYYHCSSLLVSAGTFVTEGTAIARVGSTGISSGPHLHFGVIAGGTYVDPMNYFSRN